MIAPLLAALILAAPPLQFGNAVPLANVRYGNVDATMPLASNGRDFFAMWMDTGGSKIAKLGTASDVLIGHPVLNARQPVIAWTGENFFVAADNQIRLLDSEGAPVGPARTAIPPGFAECAATNGRNVLLLGHVENELRAYVFDRQGGLADSAGQLIETAFQWRSAIASNGSGYVSIHTRQIENRVVFTTFDPDGSLRSQQILSAVAPLSAVIASDGNEYLAAWSEGGRTLAVRVQQDGTRGVPFVLADGPGGPTSAVWTGDRYAIALTGAQVVFARAQGVLGSIPLEGASYNSPMLAATRNRLLVSFGNSVRDLSTQQSYATEFLGANGQTVFRAVSGSESTLVVWTEDRWRMGVRGRNGSWTERELPDTISKRIATDGRGFLVADFKGVSGSASYYEPDGSLRWTNVAIPFSVDDIVWSDGSFIISGSTAAAGPMLARLSTSGVLSPPVQVRTNIRPYAGATRLATDGRNLFLAYNSPSFCLVPCSLNAVVAGVLLDGDFNPIAQELVIASNTPTGSSYGLVWDGARYIVAYSEYVSADPSLRLFARRISRDGILAAGTIEIAPAALSRTFQATSTSYGTAIVWPDGARLIAQDGSVSTIPVLPSGSSGVLINLPDGKLGYVTNRLLSAEPYFGAWRMTLSVGDIVAPARVPDAPKATVSLSPDHTLLVQWSAPPQPVQGYRVEYKIGAQDWMELESWFRPYERTLNVTAAGSPAVYAFRVRAWSDSGTSAYSPPASLPQGKRRSAR